MANYDALTINEEKFIKEHIDNMTLSEIALSLGRCYSMVQKNARLLGFAKAHRWTKEEDEKLISLLGRKSVSQIAEILQVNINSVYNRTRRLTGKRK